MAGPRTRRTWLSTLGAVLGYCLRSASELEFNMLCGTNPFGPEAAKPVALDDADVAAAIREAEAILAEARGRAAAKPPKDTSGLLIAAFGLLAFTILACTVLACLYLPNLLSRVLI